jgi:cyclomaltodextrinase
VFYQIFPDRFARSDRVPKPTNLLSWDSAPTQQGYHGGDLLGVVEHLDHLVDLGINAIYLTPIFQSACNHRYHTHDYYRVDPLLGGNSALRSLVEAAHARKMRVMLDGVFNHASRGFFQFHDILENGPHSAWLDWFFIQGWPLTPYDGDRPANYTGWVNNRALPKFNTDNPAVREFLMQVGEFWIREFDIDGWRLDVPAEIKTAGFWEEFRCRTRAIKPDLYLVGEIWREAADWLRGDRFDATMNYVFAAAAIAFAAGDRVSEALVSNRSYEPFPGIDGRAFGDRIARLLATYDWDTTLVQFNLLDSHDAPRVVDIARGDKATLRLATLLQMTYPGTPCVYYGDEIGLRGTKRYDRPHRDLDARWPFPWHDESRWDREMLSYFRQAIALRRTHSALRDGDFLPLYAEGKQYAFLRHNASETMLVAFNMADAAGELHVPVSPHLRNGQEPTTVFGTPTPVTVADGTMRLSIPPRSGRVWQV